MFRLFHKSTLPHLSSFSSESVFSYLYLLLVILLPTQLGRHFWPSSSYIAGLRIDYLSPTVYVTDLLLFLLSILVMRLPYIRLQFKSVMYTILHDQYYLAALFSLAIGIALSEKPIIGVLGLVRISEIGFVGIMTKAFLEEKRIHSNYLALALGCSLLYELLLGGMQASLQHSVGGLWYFFGERTFSSITPGIANASLNGSLFLRPYGTFSHPNVLAAFFLLVSFILFHLLQRTIRRHSAPLFFIVSIGLLGVFLTLSRVGIMLVLFAGLISLLLSDKAWRKKRNVVIGLVAGGCVMLFQPMLFARFTAFDFFGQSLHLRVDYLLVSIQVFLGHPFFGVGAGEYLIGASHLSHIQYEYLREPVHNIFLLMLSETGIFGGIGIVLLLVKALKKSFREKSSYLVMVLLFVIVYGSSDHFFLTQQQGRLLLGLVLGVVFMKQNVGKPINENYSKKG